MHSLYPAMHPTLLVTVTPEKHMVHRGRRYASLLPDCSRGLGATSVVDILYAHTLSHTLSETPPSHHHTMALHRTTPHRTVPHHGTLLAGQSLQDADILKPDQIFGLFTNLDDVISVNGELFESLASRT